MAEIKFLEDELLKARTEAEGELNSYNARVQERVKHYSRGSAVEEKVCYGSLLDCFSFYFLVRNRLSNDVFRTNDGKLFASLYAMNIAAIHGLSLISEKEGEDSVKAIDVDSNVFWASHEIDLSAGPSKMCRSFIGDISSALGNGYSKPLDELVADFYKYVIEETKKAADSSRFREHHKALSQNPIRYNGMVFKGFSGGIAVGKEVSQSLSFDMLIGYEGIKKEFMSYILITRNLNEARRYWRDIHNILPNLILDGESGTGKSFSARIFGSILQRFAGSAYTEINFGNIADSYVNGATKRLAAYFDRAEEPLKKGICPLSVLYVDEVDALTRKKNVQA